MTQDDKPLKRRFNVCFTGRMRYPRHHMENDAHMRGHVNHRTIKADTDILVLADFNSLSRKAMTARRKGIRLLTEEAWLNLPDEGTAEEIDEYIYRNMFKELLGTL